jgi:hypothetical protein
MAERPFPEYWHGPPFRISSGWKLARATHTCECVLLAHEIGWELRLLIDDELHQSQLCRSAEQILEVQERWRSQMRSEGWSPEDKR